MAATKTMVATSSINIALSYNLNHTDLICRCFVTCCCYEVLLKRVLKNKRIKYRYKDEQFESPLFVKTNRILLKMC